MRLIMTFPAVTATTDGLKGDIPLAISSAFTNSLQFNISGNIVKHAVVLPAPLHPAMIYKDFGLSLSLVVIFLF